eukprot:6147650-Amphidinium_carterae.1
MLLALFMLTKGQEGFSHSVSTCAHCAKLFPCYDVPTIARRAFVVMFTRFQTSGLPPDASGYTISGRRFLLLRGSTNENEMIAACFVFRTCRMVHGNPLHAKCLGREWLI